MKKNLFPCIGLVILMCFAVPVALYSQKDTEKKDTEKKQEEKNIEKPKPIPGAYTIEQTTELMRSNKIGKIKLDHDDHVYKCMKLAKEGKDLEGAVEALYTFKTNFGDTLDNEEVNLLIQISKLDTNLYNDIALSSRDIGKKKTTVEENFTLLKSINKGSVQSLLNGIDVAKQCKYRIENDFFSSDRVELLIQIGNLKDTNRFLEIYDSMKNVGMGAAINTRGLELLYKLYSLQGDVSMKIDEYLKVNKWKSRKQPGDREYEVIRDIMKGHYATFDKMNREMSKGNSLSYEEKETPKENETPKEKENKEGSKKKARKVTENSDERRKRELAREREYDGERDRDREDEKKVTPSRKGEAKAKGKKQVDPCPCATYSK